MPIYFLTGSSHKVKEMQSIVPYVEQLEIDLPEIQELDAHKIIAAKLAEASKHKHGSFIVEDTSLYLEATPGLPGPLIKWFLKALGNDGIFKTAEAFNNYDAEAKTIIGYKNEKEDIEFFEGSTRGTIVKPRGESSFGWDPIFQPEGSSKTFAEMTLTQKNSFSMRRRAAEKLAAHIPR